MFRTVVCALSLVALPGAVIALDQVQLRLVGSDDTDLAKAVRASSVLTELEDDDSARPRDIVAAAQGDYIRLVEALYAKGHYSAVVSIRLDGQEAARMDPFRVPSAINAAEIILVPGKRFKLGQAEIGPLAVPGPPVEEFRRGEPALATTVRAAASGAVTSWREAGYAKAEVIGQSILARHPTARLDVDIDLQPGPRLRFGDTVIKGDEAVRAPRVRQIAGIPKGQQFHPDDIAKAGSRLRKTGAFQSVLVEEADTVNPDGTIDTVITVVDRKPRRLGAGAEISNLDGLTLSAFWLHRNIFGGAERLRIETEIAQIGTSIEGIDYDLSFRFEKPAVYGPDTLFYAAFGLSYLDEPDYLEEKVYFETGISQEFNETLTGEIGIGVDYSRITDRFSTGGAITDSRERELLLFSLPNALTYDTRNAALNATEGYYARGEFEPFVDTLGSDGGARLTLDARAYRGLGEEKRTVLAGRVQIGALVGPDADEALPNYLFYSGGGGSVRGQPYQSLDITYDDGSTLGGRGFAALSGEVRHSLNDRFGVVAFADAGYVSPDAFEFSAGEWHAGAGLGLRYATPVGPIRLDVAGPLTDNTAEGVQIYIGIGQAF